MMQIKCRLISRMGCHWPPAGVVLMRLWWWSGALTYATCLARGVISICPTIPSTKFHHCLMSYSRCAFEMAIPSNYCPHETEIFLKRNIKPKIRNCNPRLRARGTIANLFSTAWDDLLIVGDFNARNLSVLGNISEADFFGQIVTSLTRQAPSH